MRARAIRGACYALLFLASSCAAGEPSQPAPATPPVSPPTAPPASAPPADPDAAAVESARPSLRACYEKARTANPAIQRTTVTISLRVDEAGHVSTVDFEYKHRFDDASKGCMRDAAFAIQLPAGQARKVVVPMTFEPK